jgi:pimeloyl-ACP methyl ester carboxylesterase
MTYRCLTLACLITLLPACVTSGGLEEPATPTTSEEVTITTDDGLELAGTYQGAVGADRGPGLLLLHQFERNRADFDPIWAELLGAGYSLLAIDFRGHGASDPSPIPIGELLSDRDNLGWDVMAGLDFLQRKNFDIADDRIGAVGLSVGGNMAIVANHKTHGGQQAPWGCFAVATVSARLDRAEDLAGDTSLTLRDGLYIAGADETTQAEEAGALLDITGGDREAMLVPGTAAHGAELLEQNADVRARIVAWFSEAGL